MSKAALVAVGLALAVGVGLAIKDADAKPAPPRKPTQDDPDADDGEVIETPEAPPQPSKPEDGRPGPVPGSGSAPPEVPSALPGSPRANNLPEQLKVINLSGHERYLYQGINEIAGKDFDTWSVFDGLNGMNMVIYRSAANPDDWISMFIHPDPPPSDPPAHMIIHKVSDSVNKDWMIINLAKSRP